MGRAPRLFAGGAALLLLVGLVLLLTARARLAEVEERNAELAREVCLLDPCCEDGAPIPGCERTGWQTLAADLERRLASIDELHGRGEQLPAWLDALETAIPAGAWLTRLEVTPDRLDLHGRSATMHGAAAAMTGLQDSPCFVGVELLRTEARRPGPGQEFSLRAELVTDCPSGGADGRDLFRPTLGPEDDAAPPAHRQVRWDLRSYQVIAVSPGDQAWIRDPDGATWPVQEGSVIGDRGAVVTVITDESLILTLDEILDEETGEAATRIITLRQEQDPQVP